MEVESGKRKKAFSDKKKKRGWAEKKSEDRLIIKGTLKDGRLYSQFSWIGVKNLLWGRG